MPRLAASIIFVLLVAIAASSASQRAPAAAISDALRAHVQAERFEIVTSIRGLPLGVRDELQSMWRSATLDIAEPGAPFQGTTVSRTLPSRRLIAAGCSADHHCLAYYERAGGGNASLAALFQWSPTATRFVGGGTIPGGLKTIEEVRQAFVSGTIGPAEGW